MAQQTQRRAAVSTAAPAVASRRGGGAGLPRRTSQRQVMGGGRGVAQWTQRGGGVGKRRTRRGGADGAGSEGGENDSGGKGKGNKKAPYHNPTSIRSVYQWLDAYQLTAYSSLDRDFKPVENANDLIPYPIEVPPNLDAYDNEKKYKDFFVPQAKYYMDLQKSLSEEDKKRTEIAFTTRLDQIRCHCKLPLAKPLTSTASINEGRLWDGESDDKVKDWWEAYKKHDALNADINLTTCKANYHKVHTNLVALDKHIEKKVAAGDEDSGLGVYQLDLLGKRVKEMIKILKKQCKAQAKEVDVPHIATKLQVLEADRRQLLMLLCGNVPATLLVDKRTGYIRRPKQICHHIQFLLRRHRMTNSSVGRYTKILTSTLRAGRIGAGYMVMLVAWSGLLLATMGMLTGAVYMFHGTRLNQFVRRRVIYGLFKMVLYMWSVVMGILDKLLGTGRPDWTYNVHALRGNPTRDTDALLQWMTSVGFAGVIYKVLNSWKVDVDKTRRVTALCFLIQKVNDQWSLLQVSHYIAQSQTGLFGEDSASGLTDDQMGLMYKVQKALKELDEEIDLDSDRTVDQGNIHELLDEYGNTYKSGSRQRLCIELHNAYQRAQTHALNPRHFRARMLKDYEHEFRAHHFFNSYGEPRSVLHIVLAYLLCWRREKMNTVLPTVPYKGRELVDDYMNPMNMMQLQEQREHVLKGEWWQLNPIQCSEWARLHASDPLVREERTVDNTAMYTEGPATARDYEEERHTKETKAYRQHLNLDYLFKNQKGYDGWIQSKLGRSEVAMNKFRNISGWTHRVSDALLARVNQQFEVMNANDATDYKRWQERQVMGRDRASVNVDKNYHRVLHGEVLAKSGLFSKKDAGLEEGGDTDDVKAFDKLANTLFMAQDTTVNMKDALENFRNQGLFASSYPQYEAYEELHKCIGEKPDDAENAQKTAQKTAQLLLYWCGFFAMSAEKYDDEEYIDLPGNPPVKNPFRDDPNDQGDAHAKLRKGYSKVLANRLGTKGVEDLHVYFENCHFIKYVKEHKDNNEYLEKCLEQMRTTM